jgi:hypothetical protein
MLTRLAMTLIDISLSIYLDKKNSICFDSGMPSTTSNNSDSACSQALSASDLDGQLMHGFYDRPDGEHLVQGRLSNKKALLPDIQEMFLTKLHGQNDVAPYTMADSQAHLPRISSEEESGFSTPTRSQPGKKLVYEVVV